MKKVLKVIENTASEQEACCVPELRSTLEKSQAIQAADLFAALADPTRLTILNLLSESQGEICVCDITASFKLGQPTISHHLKILRDAGLISGDKRGKWVYYSLVASRAEEVKIVLDRVIKSPLLV
jgi:ArsR family transcriptional regulator